MWFCEMTQAPNEQFETTASSSEPEDLNQVQLQEENDCITPKYKMRPLNLAAAAVILPKSSTHGETDDSIRMLSPEHSAKQAVRPKKATEQTEQTEYQKLFLTQQATVQPENSMSENATATSRSKSVRSRKQGLGGYLAESPQQWASQRTNNSEKGTHESKKEKAELGVVTERANKSISYNPGQLRKRQGIGSKRIGNNQPRHPRGLRTRSADRDTEAASTAIRRPKPYLRRQLSDRSERQTKILTRLTQVSGQNPWTESSDDEQRVELLEKLQRFYHKHNSPMLKNGIGHIADYGIRKGIQKLNRNLKERYGEDLTSIEPEGQINIQGITVPFNEAEEGIEDEFLAIAEEKMRRKRVREKLIKFYQKHNKKMVKKGVAHIVDYAMVKGIDRLNKKLKSRYGEDLTTFDLHDRELNQNVLEKPELKVVARLNQAERAAERETSNKELLVKNRNRKSPRIAAQVEQRTFTSNYLNQEFAIKDSPYGQRSPGSTRRSPGSARRSPGSARRSPGSTRRSPGDMGQLHSPPILAPQLSARLSPGRSDARLQVSYRISGKERSGRNLHAQSARKPPQDSVRNSPPSSRKLPSQRISGDRSREFKRRLVEFLLQYEPDRIDKCLYLMTKYQEKNGLKKLNQKLLGLYGDNLSDFETEDGDSNQDLDAVNAVAYRTHAILGVHRVDRKSNCLLMTKKDSEMLNLFFAKYDPAYLVNENIDKVHDWTASNGMASLNRRLKRRYNEDLDEFMFATQKLRLELIEFYTLIDRAKLINGLNDVLTWAVVNGRAALNQNIYRKYGCDLDSSTKEVRTSSVAYMRF